MPKINTYVEFYFRGSLFDKTEIYEFASRREVEKVNVPDSAFAFRFFDVMSTEEGGVKMSSERLNISPMHYYGGRIMTLEEVRQEMPEARTLISNMEGSEYSHVILCRTGNFKPFQDKDIYIEV